MSLEWARSSTLIRKHDASNSHYSPKRIVSQSSFLIQIRRIQPSFRLQFPERLQRLPNPLDQRRQRHRAEIVLQGAVVEIVRDRNLPLAERDQLRRARFRFA